MKNFEGNMRDNLPQNHLNCWVEIKKVWDELNNNHEVSKETITPSTTPSPIPSLSRSLQMSDEDDLSGYFYNLPPSKPWYVQAGLISDGQDDTDDNASSNSSVAPNAMLADLVQALLLYALHQHYAVKHAIFW